MTERPHARPIAEAFFPELLDADLVVQDMLRIRATSEG